MTTVSSGKLAPLSSPTKPQERGPASRDRRATGSFVATLPGHAYVDEDWFDKEQRHVFSKQWCCVARAQDLLRPGQFQVVQVARESVIVNRDTQGQLRAFLNVCRHRGSRICTASSGEVKRVFRCGYHAWTYGLDGRLLSAPNLASMPDIDKEACGLIPVALREWLGYLWIALGDEPPSFEDSVVSQVNDRLGDPEAIERYTLDQLVVGRRVSYDVAANWKLIVENFMECYHCATIHPELTEVLPEFREGFAAQYYVGHGAEFGKDIKGFTVDGRPGFSKIDTLTEAQDRRYFAITVRPQVFVNLVPDHVIFHRMRPVAPDRTVVECDWLYSRDVVDANVDLDASVELFHRVNIQDFAACERTQPAMSSQGYEHGGVLVPSEHHIADFHRWLAAEIGEDL